MTIVALIWVALSVPATLVAMAAIIAGSRAEAETVLNDALQNNGV